MNHCAHRQHRQTQSINQTNQSCIFRVVQLIKSLQDPLEVGNNLPGINDNPIKQTIKQACVWCWCVHKKIQLYLLVFTDFSNKWQKPDDSWEMKQLCGHIGTVRHCQHLQRLNHCIHRQHRQTQSINQTNQSCISRVVQLIHWRWGIIYRESMIISRNEAWNRNVFRRWRKADRDGHWSQFNHFTEWTHSSLHRIPQFPIALAICRTFFQVTFNFPDFSMLSRLQLMRS